MTREPAKAETRKGKFKNMNKPKTNQHLHRKIAALAVIAGLGIAALSALPKAHADQPVAVSGTFNLCGHPIWDTLHQAGRNITVDLYQNQNFFGPMVGTLYITPDDPEFDVLHLAKDGVTLIRVNFHGSGTFAGSVLGRTTSAAAIMGYQAQIAPDGSGHGTWWLDDPVAGIHGNGTLDGNPPDPNPCEVDGSYVTGTYTGQIQLTP
jgi:hypothetical protein